MILLEAEALLFDSDGVLIDSHRLVEQAWRQIAAELGLDADRLVREQPGFRAEDTLRNHAPPDRIPEAAARLEALEMDLVSETKPLPGALDLTEQLPTARWAIVTSGTRRLATARWQTVGIPIPPTIVTAEDASAGKPDPAPYLRATNLLDVDPARCVVFEDSPSGGAAASALGATVVAVGDQPWPIEPQVRVHDLTQIVYNAGAHADGPISLTVGPPAPSSPTRT